MELTDRQNKILDAIVKEYIDTGQPVGSKKLSETLHLGVSPATIRSEMAELYEKGYLEQPHTSAGRIPSYTGIRTYIDSLMKMKPLSKREKADIDSLFNVRNPDPDKLLENAAEALSDYTGYASVTSAQVADTVEVKRLEFIPAGLNTVVIILIDSNGAVHNKVCRVDFLVTDKIMDFFNKFANSRFAGRGIDSITASYVSSVGLALGEYSRLFTPLIIAVFELCEEISHGKYYVSGSTKLLNYSNELGQLAKNLLGMIESPDNLQKLFGSDFINYRILVGKENSVVELTDSSVVVTQYYVGNEPAGTVGLIGPMRLNYSKIIPHLEYFAQTLGKLFDETLNPGEEQEFYDNIPRED